MSGRRQDHRRQDQRPLDTTPGAESQVITSAQNSRIRQVRRLERRRARDASGLAVVEGIRPTVEALRSQPESVSLTISAPRLLTSQLAREALAEAEAAGIERIEVSPEVFRSISSRDRPQGLAAVVRQRWHRLRSEGLSDGDLWIALTAVADPGNLGTILRSAEAVGARGLILLEESADPWSHQAIRASTGAVFRQRLVRSDWRALLEWAREQGASISGASGDGGESYRGADYGRRTLLLMGSEREGLSAAQRRACNQLLAIPMAGVVDSLNLGVAASLLLYEWRHQQAARAGDG